MAPYKWLSRRTGKPTLRSLAACIRFGTKSSSSSAPCGATGGHRATTDDPEVLRLQLWADLQHLGAIGEMTQWDLDQVSYGRALMVSVGMRLLLLQSLDQA